MPFNHQKYLEEYTGGMALSNAFESIALSSANSYSHDNVGSITSLKDNTLTLSSKNGDLLRNIRKSFDEQGYETQSTNLSGNVQAFVIKNAVSEKTAALLKDVIAQACKTTKKLEIETHIHRG